jgi:hypothetical protein
MASALDQYSRDSRPLRIFLRYATDRIPEGNERDLVSTILKRLPLLLDEAPDLAYLALPFIRDTEEARRLISSYRAEGGNESEAIPAALGLGVIDETMAIDELFQQSVQDKNLLLSVWKLLRSAGGQAQFRRNLAGFSGVIQEDMDGDGYPESWTRYRNGIIEEYNYDANQDGLFEWRLFWSAGVPIRGEIAVALEPPAGQAAREGVPVPPGGSVAFEEGAVGLPLRDSDRTKAQILWERYTALLKAGLETITYLFNPWEFSFTPLRFAEFPGAGTDSIVYPERDHLEARLTKRTLVSFAAMAERPSREFQGAVERITLARGIPQRTAEYLEGRMISVTEFILGRPTVQRIDLDLDGRMETVRRFRREAGPPGPGEGYLWDSPWDYTAVLATSESDWDGDGIYETGEEYLPTGAVARSWDLDKDGVKEYTVIVAEQVEVPPVTPGN